jgi:hypothetical protein
VSATDTQTIGWGATVIGTMNVQVQAIDGVGVNASSVKTVTATNVTVASTFGRSRSLGIVAFRTT